MSPVAALPLLVFALAVPLAPWRDSAWRRPVGALVSEAASLVIAVAAAVVLEASLRTPPSWEVWGRTALYVSAYAYGVGGGIGVVRMVLRLVPVGETAPPGGIAISGTELARGRIIGMLERAIAVTLLLLGEFGALGLIVAAKALARFRGLQDREFAEYFLIGTLASLLQALIVGVGVGLLLGG